MPFKESSAVALQTYFFQMSTTFFIVNIVKQITGLKILMYACLNKSLN